MFKKIMLWACMLVAITAGCSKEETITEKQLMETLDGYGWKWSDSTPLDKKKENKLVEGTTTQNYYFHDGIVTVYWCPDSLPEHCFLNLSIRYDASNNEIDLLREDGILSHSLQVKFLSGNRFKAISSIRKNMLQTWRKMTEEELNSCQAKYTFEYPL